MRGRVIGLGLLGLGAFLLAGALAVRLLLEPGLVKLPLDQKAKPTAVGSDISWYDFENQQQLRGLEADVRQEVEGRADDPAANDDVAVWNFGSTITATDGTLLNAGTYRVCLDRRTAAAVDCQSDHVEYDDDVQIEGLTLTFPFGTEKRDYDVFSSTARQTFTATFEGVEDKGGLETYRFQMSVPETVAESAELPAAVLGRTGDPVPIEVVYSNERTIWVEPVSGVIVTSVEEPNSEMRDANGDALLTILSGSFAGTDETISDGVKRAQDYRDQISLVKTTIPLILLLVGLALLVVGALLLRRSRTGAHRSDTVEVEAVREPQVW
jgi:Porin PorA